MVLAASSSPIAVDDTASSAFSFDQQLQLLKLQKDKLELELKVLTLSMPGMPSALDNNTLAHPSQPSHNKRNIHWPRDFVPSIQGEYNKIQLPEIVAGFLIMIKYYNKASKDATLAHLELLTIEAISCLWVSVRDFHKFIANMLSGVIWIGKILSLFRIRPPLFSTIHTRLHPLLPRLVDLFVISKMLMLLRNTINADLYLSALIFQCPTKAAVHIFPKQGFLADVYLDDFYGAEYPFLAASAFSQLSQLFHQLGLDSAPDRDSPPSTSMICPTVAFPLEVPTTSLMDLQAALTTCQAASFFTTKQLQSLLGKLSFLTA
ncbi:unnamed protein product, partial [Porites evermanni]